MYKKLLHNKSNNEGFTLIELIVVIGILVFLLSVVLVAVDPGRRFSESKNAQRYQEATSVLNAVLKYQADNDGAHLTSVENMTAGSDYIIGTDTTGCDTGCTQAGTTEASCTDLTGLVDEYIQSVPVAPDTDTWDAAQTGYYISKSTNDRITVGACTPDDEDGTTPTIEVAR